MGIYKFLLLSLIIGLLAGSTGAYVVVKYQEPSKSDLIKNFYATENYVHISPHQIRKAIARGDNSFILVDLRSQEEYEKEHILGAINIPAYKDPNTSAYDEIDRIVGEFSKLPKDKDIIVYCYSIPCMTGRKVGKMLAENGIYVSHLGIGWNEWRYYWNLWNHEYEWNITNVGDYVTKGKEPGTFKGDKNATACKIKGEFGC